MVSGIIKNRVYKFCVDLFKSIKSRALYIGISRDLAPEPNIEKNFLIDWQKRNLLLSIKTVEVNNINKEVLNE